MKAKRRGFTIVELLMVIGIIGVLMGIVTTAASSSVKMSRRRKAQALCHMVQSGLAVYYAQKDKWPIEVEGLTRGEEGTQEKSLDASQVKQCMIELINETKNGNPMLDISGLFVSEGDGEPKEYGKCHTCGDKRWQAPMQYGMDFMSAIHGTKRHPEKMSTSKMTFGYPHPENGRFMRFHMQYNFATDQISVGTWHWDHQ